MEEDPQDQGRGFRQSPGNRGNLTQGQRGQGNREHPPRVHVSALGRFMIMDRLEKLIHLVIEALEKARELTAFPIDRESKAKVARLMERARKTRNTIEALNEVFAANGKGLDKA